MRRFSVAATAAFCCLVLFFCVCPGAAQIDPKSFPKAVFAAKTVAILNSTHSDEVEKGAVEVLQRWHRFTIVDDPDTADVILTFDKKSAHEGKDSQKTDSTGKPTEYGYGISFSSSITMKASLKGSDTPFYTTKTGDSKKKAGATCVNNLEAAYLEAH